MALHVKSLLQANWVGTWVGSLMAMVLGFLFLNPVLGKQFRQTSYDLPFYLRVLLRAPTPPPGIAIVSLPQTFDARLPITSFPARAQLAEVLPLLKAGGARDVLVDFFLHAEDPANDPILVRALTNHGGVILGSYAEIGLGRRLRQARLANPKLLAAAATNGFLQFSPDDDSVVRSFEPSLRVRSRLAGGEWSETLNTTLPTLSCVSALRSDPRLAERLARSPRPFWLNYYGPAGTFEWIAHADAGQRAKEGAFQGKIVLVGQQHDIEYPGPPQPGHDTFASPFGLYAPPFDGVEIHATALCNLLRGEWLTELSPVLQLLWVLAVGGGLGYLLPRVHPLMALVIAGATALSVTAAACWLALGLRVWFPWLVTVAIQIPVALIWAVNYQAARAQFEKQLLARSLALYLSPKQVQNLQRRPELLQRGGRQQAVSILFSDIAGFAKIAERMDAEDLVRLLNQYYEDAIACVHQTDGTVMKLIGDAIFAIWNAPEEQADHQARACQAALLLNDRVVAFNAQQGRLPLRTRVGLHTGTACVGNIGSSDHFDYTAIGEAVNLASRLESLNKQVGTNLLATRDFLKGLEPRFVSRMVGYFRLKGFDHVVEVHEVLGRTESADDSAAWRQAFGLGVHHFVRRDFAAAEEAFRTTLSLRPGDGPAWYYLHLLPEFRTMILPDDWAGEIEPKEK